MKRSLLLVGMVAISAPALAAVSVNIGEPGFYGRIDIGSFPSPRLVYAEPVVIQRAPVGVVREPIYLHVRPGHERKWSRHCREYNACGQPVYFVHDDWYKREYVPRYREHHGRDDRGERRGDDRGERHGDDRGERHGDERGEGHDRDRGGR